MQEIPVGIPRSWRPSGEGMGYPLQHSWASLGAQLVNNPPAIWETWVPSLGWEDPLEKERLPPPVFWPGEFHGLYIVYEVTKSQTGLNDFHFHLPYNAVSISTLQQNESAVCIHNPPPFCISFKKNLQTRNAGEGVEKRERFYTVGEYKLTRQLVKFLSNLEAQRNNSNTYWTKISLTKVVSTESSSLCLCNKEVSCSDS